MNDTVKRFCNALAAAPQEAVKAGDETLVQLVPPGDWPQWDEKGKEFSQKCDEKTFQTLLENFSGEVLVDADHASEREGARDTKAYAWIQALSVDDSGALCGAFRWTDIGAEAVSNRRYRFVSVCWACEKEGKAEWRPVKLVSVALTNTPNIPAKPILNQQESAGGASAEKQKDNKMEQLKTLLGLAADATDDQVAAAVKALKERLDALEAQAKDAEAERFASENAAKCDKETLKNAYLQSPEVAKALVAGMKAPQNAAPASPALPDFSKGRAPARLANAAAPLAKTGPAEIYKHYAAMAEGAEKDAYLAANAQAISDGYEAVHNVR